VQVTVETERDLSPEAARRALALFPGILTQGGHESYPTPWEAAGRDGVFVGRIRRDPDLERTLHLWVVADNLRKGAATNAVQIVQGLRGG